MVSAVMNKKLKEILDELNSGEENKVIKALKELEVNGNASVIKPLADTLLKEKSDKNRAAIIDFLSNLKDSSVCVEIMDVIQDEKYALIRQELLGCIWNTKVDFSSYIDDFVEIAVTGTFMEALDCLTIIENLEGPFLEEDILECQLHLRNYIEDSAPKDEQKARILSEIAILIKDINQHLMD